MSHRRRGARKVVTRAGALALACALACAAAGSGCASSGDTVSPTEGRCRRLCEASKACASAAGSRPVDCYGSCDDLEALNHANECFDEAKDYYDCIERHGVCSDIDSLCIESQDVYSDCLADPCSTDPERDICA